MSNIIEVLDEGRLGNVFGEPPEGQIARTFAANVTWSDGRLRRSYVKMFRAGHFLCLVNEITGYLLGRGCQLPLPARAGLMKIPEGVAEDQSLFQPWAFVVSEVPGRTPTSILQITDDLTNEHISAVVDLLSSWPRLNDAIAFDDWTANQDRNLGNFICAGPDEVFLIDHSNLPVGIGWTADSLEPDRVFDNHLAAIFGLPEEGYLPQKRAIVVSATNHQRAFESVADELVYWWNLFLDSDAERRQAIEDFLTIRAIEGHKRLSSHLNLLAVER